MTLLQEEAEMGAGALGLSSASQGAPPRQLPPQGYQAAMPPGRARTPPWQGGGYFSALQVRLTLMRTVHLSCRDATACHLDPAGWPPDKWHTPTA